MSRIKLTLVDGWQRAWRWASVQFAVLIAAWGLLPADTQAAVLGAIGIPEHRQAALIGGLFLLARLLTLPPKPDPAAGE